MPAARRLYRQHLDEIHSDIVDALNLADCQVTRTVDALLYRDTELAEIVIGADTPIDERYAWIHTKVLSVLARESPVAGDLRFLTSALTISRCIERIGDQCANAAKLVALSPAGGPSDETTLRLLTRMGAGAHRQLAAIYESLTTEATLDPEQLGVEQTLINRLDREVLQWCTQLGTDAEMREWSMLMVLAARCMQRISENAIEVARQLTFVKTGTFIPT